MARRAKKAEAIHPAIKEALGYPAQEPDALVYSDWIERKKRVCKPCWELKYCPYGPLVEQSPFLPSLRSETIEHNELIKGSLHRGYQGSVHKLSDQDRAQYTEWIKDDDLMLHQALYQIRDQRRLDAIAKLGSDEERLNAFRGGQLPPIHIYRASYDHEVEELSEDTIPTELLSEAKLKAREIKEVYEEALRTGMIDDRRPIHPVRKLWLEFMLNSSDPQDLPESIPETFSEAACNVFGHICPVFFAAEALTETSTERRRGRYIPFDIKMRVVRRDNYTYQHCRRHLRDDEVEFDHIIPVSKGGSSEEHNIRLTCFKCNRDKSDDYVP